MPDPDGVAGHEYSDDVEPVGLPRDSESVDPDVCGPGQLPLLSPGDGLDGIAERFPAPRLHLHEYDDSVLFRDEVHVPPAAAEPMGDDAPPAPPEPPCRYPLPKFSEPLPGR